MSKRFAFPRGARLLCEREFRLVHARGGRFAAFPLRFRMLRRSGGQSRLGLSVGTKAGNAVERNRWKRAIREAFRLHRHRLREPYDVAASVDWEAAPGDMAGVRAAVLSLIEALNRSGRTEVQP